MFTKTIRSFCILALSVISISAFAEGDPQLDGIKGGVEADLKLLSDFHDLQIGSIAQNTLNILVGEALDGLREQGEVALADQLANEWKNQFQNYLTSVTALDLGDHDPLSPWLANFYDTLMRKTNGAVRQIRILSDINTLNYAIAVTIKPQGKWRMGTRLPDSIEYRKHFIPFADIATYWTTYGGCLYAVAHYNQPNFKQFCKPVAEKLEHLMGRYVAPKISDWIFNKSNHYSSEWLNSMEISTYNTQLNQVGAQ